MMKRVRQFFRALFADVSAEDRAFAKKHLDERQRVLFFGVSVPDQQHAIRTARTALSLAESATGEIDLPLLTRCALLHDVGRKKGDLGTCGKTFAVLFAALFPRFARACGRDESNGIIARKMHVYFHHPEIGADALSSMGYSQEAEIIRKHHKAPAEDDPPELRILRMADELN